MQVKAAVTLGYQQPFVIKDVEVALPGKDEILVKNSSPPASAIPTP